MNFKLLPWILVTAFLALAGYYYAADTKKRQDLETLRTVNDQLEAARASEEAEVSSRNQLQDEELGRLRKENEDLLRLRNEVRQLREEKQQLSTELQSTKASVQAAQTQAQNAQLQVQNAQSQLQTLQAQARQPAAGFPGGVAPGNLAPADPASACINVLRQIDGAKQQWALENRKSTESAVNAADLTPYLRGNMLPRCPAGGTYVLGSVAQQPSCTVPGHALPR